jgi:hypothetical protein
MSKLSTIEEVDSSLTPVLGAVEPSPSDFIGPAAVDADETGSVLPLAFDPAGLPPAVSALPRGGERAV